MDFPRAESTDGMPVFIYRTFIEDEKGRVLKERKTIPPYYLYEVKEKLSVSLGRLTTGKYKIKILAETPYGVQSEYIEKTIEVKGA